MFTVSFVIIATIFCINLILAKSVCDLQTNKSFININCNEKRWSNGDFSVLFKPSVEYYLKRRNNTNSRIVIQLDRNELTIIGVLFKISAIFSISLKQNKLIKLEDGVFRNLRTLKKVYLNHNHLRGELLTKDTFRYGSAIDELDFSFNNISNLHSDVFKFVPNLKILILSGNPIKLINENIINAITSMKKLQTLHLANIQMKSMPSTMFQSNIISDLYLNDNYLAEVPNCLQNIAYTLTTLNLNANPISEINENSFKRLSQLRILHLSGMPNLKTIKKKSFAELGNLILLECSFNKQLEYLDPDSFHPLAKNKNLLEISLNNNNFNYLSNDTINWNRISSVKLDGNPWNCSCSMKWLIDYVKAKNLHYVRCAYPSEYKIGSSVPNLNCSENIHWGLEMSGEYKSESIPSSYGIILVIIFVFILLLVYVSTRRYFSKSSFSRKSDYKLIASNDAL